MNKPKVVVVVGPTASGKTGVAIEIAKKFDGEVISADSRQVYRGLDIGTAKVSTEEMDGVPHHLLDVADPMEVYTVTDFVHDATAALEGILKRGRLPIIAGGTFFYIDALLGKVATPNVPPNPTLRTHLEERPATELFAELTQKDPKRAVNIDRNNKRRLIRALEIVDAIGTVPPPQTTSPYTSLTIGLTTERDVLNARIRERLLMRLDAGMIKEVQDLIAAGTTYERLEDLGLEYRYVSRYLRNELTYEVMVAELTTKICQYAKRQQTWLKRDSNVAWFAREQSEALFARLTTFLTSTS